MRVGIVAKGLGSGESCLHIGLDVVFVAWHVPVALLEDASVSRDDHAERRSSAGIIERNNSRLLVEQDGKRKLVALGVGANLGNRLWAVHRNANDEQAFCLVLLIYPVEMRHFGQAWLAPCGPEIHQDDLLPDVLRKREGLAFHAFESEIGDLRSVGLFAATAIL